MRTSLLTIMCFILSSCSFGHLTAINNQDKTAPTAKECGGCHVDQYVEWQQTKHARAFTSKPFKQQSDHYSDTDCLFCHTPGDVQNPKREPRRYNREEGVTCVSCHLHNNAMQGPHDSGALISPHAIAQNNNVNSKKDSAKLCGICHEETYEEWLQYRAQSSSPTCHSCHGAPVKRTHTKGTNLFSDILVAFESEHEVRSHHLILPGQENPESAPQLQLITDHDDEITFTITNTLPHNLPTGSFGEKQMSVQVNRINDDRVLVTESLVLPAILSPGQRITRTLSLPQKEFSDQVQFRLMRFHESSQKSTLIRTYSFQEGSYATTP